MKESRDRVMTALINSGFSFTVGRTTINLAPADVKKEGPNFDLSFAVGMVAAREQMGSDRLENFAMVPSEADIKVTRDLTRAGQLLKIEVLDHVILGRATQERPQDYLSLRALGYFYT